ncbi:tRNA lysidine(34) synthetase TilS [Rubrivirga sp.]|uniref:tRNA lysidine(34) synthetase TilS n=1 Tax=Rubrivirga sp. TaxID=1885344 RepID=UPI003B526879
MTLAASVRAGLDAVAVGPGDRVLVAASGGLDSTALLHTLVEIGQPVVAAHVDHQLRPDSDADGAFVAELAAKLGVPCVRLAVTVGEGNRQAQARRARYAALADAAREQGCPAVATAHTATDQAETVLLALARGAGLRGLAGMPVERALAPGVRLVRPLLQSARADVEAAARAAGWTWRDDPSNATGVYARNRLRHTVLPALRAEGGADRRIAASADAARAGLAVVQRHLDGLAVGDQRLGLGVAALDAEIQSVLLAEAVARWAPDAARSRAVVARLVALLEAEVGACVEAGGVRVWRERDALRFETDVPAPDLGHLVSTPLDAVPAAFPPDRLTEVVDADRVDGPVALRSWRPGDRIRPLGMDGSRLVVDVLRERGVPRADRPAAAVVTVGDRVAWVVGHRLAASVAVTGGTRRAARWTWRPSRGAG